ncbi:hypothetical protein [Thermomonospora umbrina]|uniref:Uncharacterized protein n=1 Tax=Thermomonospora umbrina TaxID=111806 RepID=A0A3D9SY09_9ACTN|nr:hypothetical protein [Thermomonospora umbrina]REE99390.1 hypothetical protein DFJ69_4902 [Thermomonospora umbrina]
MSFAKIFAAIAIPGAALAALAAPGTASADPLPGETPFSIEETYGKASGYKSLSGARGTVTDKGGDGRGTTFTVAWYQLINGQYVLKDVDNVTAPDGQSVDFTEYPDVNGSVFVANWNPHSLSLA